MGELPVSKFRTLLAEPVRNGLYKKAEFHGSGVKVVNMGELFKYPRVGAQEMKRMQLSDNEKRVGLLANGDLLFARRSLTAEGAGKCALVTGLTEETTFESSIIRARPDQEKANSEFLFYLFNSPQGVYLLGTILRQVAVSGITGTDLVELELPCPDVNEQRAIASVLSSLDAKIDLLHRQNKTLEAMAEALFRQWFVEQAEEGWEEGTLGDIMEVKGGTTPSTANAAFWDGEFCWTTPKDLSGDQNLYLFDTARKITEDGLKQIGSGLQPEGTLLLSSRAPVGYMAFAAVPMAVNQGYIAINGNEGFSNRFIYLWLKGNMETVKGHANGSTFQEISKAAFKSIELTIPPSERVEAFDEVIEPLFEKVKTNQLQTQSLTKLRDTLLPKLMSGEVRVELESQNA